MRRRLLAGFLALVGALLLAQLGAPPAARSLSCAAPKGPLPPAPVYHVELSAKETALDAPASVDLFGRYTWGICSGTGPRVTLEASVADGEFEPAGGVAVYRRGTPFTCSAVTGSPASGSGCSIAWGTEDLAFVAAPSESTEYRLRVGPLVSGTVTVSVASPRPEERCQETAATLGTQPPQLLVTSPERTRIVFGESVRVRGTFAYELCGRRLHPEAQPGIESRGSGAVHTNQPAKHILSGPIREPSGDLIYELAPPETTAYRLYYLGDFGKFTTIEVAPNLEISKGRAKAGRVLVRIQAQASSSLAGAQVRVERRSGSAWKHLQTVTLNEDLAAVANVAAARGNIEIRVAVPRTSHYAAAVSSTLLIRGTPAPAAVRLVARVSSRTGE